MGATVRTATSSSRSSIRGASSSLPPVLRCWRKSIARTSSSTTPKTLCQAQAPQLRDISSHRTRRNRCAHRVRLRPIQSNSRATLSVGKEYLSYVRCRTQHATHNLIDLGIGWTLYEPGSLQECTVFPRKKKRATGSDATGKPGRKPWRKKHSTANTGSRIPVTRECGSAYGNPQRACVIASWR